MPIHTRRLDQANDRRRLLAAAQRPSEEPVRTPKRPRPNGVFDWVIVDGHGTIIQVARQRYPALQALLQGLGRSRAFWHKLALS